MFGDVHQKLSCRPRRRGTHGCLIDFFERSINLCAGFNLFSLSKSDP